MTNLEKAQILKERFNKGEFEWVLIDNITIYYDFRYYFEINTAFQFAYLDLFDECDHKVLTLCIDDIKYMGGYCG